MDVPVLVCTAGELAGLRVAVPEGGLGIGRSLDNVVVVNDEGVSRYHARLLFDNGSLWLQDAGSRNGVFVNGVRVTGHRALKVGDTITLARHVFELRWHDEVQAAHAPTGVHPAVAAQRTPTEDDQASRRAWYWPFS
jgi:pSer/pThr/pTyr-binding forkhead associated (FHA) protein